MDTGQDTGTLRITIREAAARLGVTEAAIRKRIQRGSLGKELGEDGRVYVYLDLSQDTSHLESQVDRDLLVEDLREQVHYLRSILTEERDARRRADTIIAQLTQANAALAQRVPELEAPQAGEGGAERPAEGTARVGYPPSNTEAHSGSERVSWWRKMFGR